MKKQYLIYLWLCLSIPSYGQVSNIFQRYDSTALEIDKNVIELLCSREWFCYSVNTINRGVRSEHPGFRSIRFDKSNTYQQHKGTGTWFVENNDLISIQPDSFDQSTYLKRSSIELLGGFYNIFSINDTMLVFSKKLTTQGDLRFIYVFTSTKKSIPEKIPEKKVAYLEYCTSILKLEKIPNTEVFLHHYEPNHEVILINSDKYRYYGVYEKKTALSGEESYFWNGNAVSKFEYDFDLKKFENIIYLTKWRIDNDKDLYIKYRLNYFHDNEGTETLITKRLEINIYEIKTINTEKEFFKNGKRISEELFNRDTEPFAHTLGLFRYCVQNNIDYSELERGISYFQEVENYTSFLIYHNSYCCDGFYEIKNDRNGIETYFINEEEVTKDYFYNPVVLRYFSSKKNK